MPTSSWNGNAGVSSFAMVTKNDLVRVTLRVLQKTLQLASEHYRIELQSYPLPIQAGDSNHQLLLDSLNKFDSFEGAYFGNSNDWSIGSSASKLTELVEQMPLLNESDRMKFRQPMRGMGIRVEGVVKRLSRGA